MWQENSAMPRQTGSDFFPPSLGYVSVPLVSYCLLTSMEVESFSKLEIMCKQWNNIEAHNILYTRSITGRPQNSETPKLGRRPVTAYRYCFSFYLMGFYGTLLVIRNGRIHQLRPFIIISLSLSFSFFSSLSFFFLFFKAGSGCFSRRVMETSMSACLLAVSVGCSWSRSMLMLLRADERERDTTSKTVKAPTSLYGHISWAADISPLARSIFCFIFRSDGYQVFSLRKVLSCMNVRY